MRGRGEYDRMPARLRMQTIGNPGVDKLDFELWCLAASAVGGCEACVVSHEKAVRERGATPGMVQDAVRIAAVVNALAVTLGSLDDQSSGSSRSGSSEASSAA
jgi:alkyl hydroperoxide reductase subunit D